MMNDSVREELALKISPIVKSAKPAAPAAVEKEIPKPQIPPIMMTNSSPSMKTTIQQQTPVKMPTQSAVAAPVVMQTSIQNESRLETMAKPLIQPSHIPPVAPQATSTAPPVEQKTIPAPTLQKPQTSEIASKATSPTLVEFRHKNAAVPEWRLQLQNAVRKRQDRTHTQTETVVSAVAAPQPVITNVVTNGATALQVEPAVQNNPMVAGNPKLEAAMRRIEQSRQLYYAEEEKPKPNLTAVPQPMPSAPQPPPVKAQPKTFPYVVQESQKPAESFIPKTAEIFTPVARTQPKTFIIEKKTENTVESKIEKFDTNKLPPLSQVTKAMPNVESRSVSFKATENKFEEPIDDYVDETDDVLAYAENEDFEATAMETAEELEEIDDCAPVSLRFNAGLFDLIIGSFLSFILLSPFMLLNGNLFTMQGALAFLATCSIVMFIYLTVTIGFLGRTFGMRLFSLEIIDIEENDYPTFHQAAVNSCVYLFSLALGGIGFLPLFFNSEKRAAHDLLAGTMVVKEEY